MRAGNRLDLIAGISLGCALLCQPACADNADPFCNISYSNYYPNTINFDSPATPGAPTPLSNQLLTAVHQNFAKAVERGSAEGYEPDYKSLLTYWERFRTYPVNALDLERRLRPFSEAGGTSVVSMSGFLGPSNIVVTEAFQKVELKNYLNPAAIEKTRATIEKGGFGKDVRSLEDLWAALREETLETALRRGQQFSQKVGKSPTEIHRILRGLYDEIVIHEEISGGQKPIFFTDARGTEFEGYYSRYMGFQYSPFGEAFDRTTLPGYGIGRIEFKVFRLTPWGGGEKLPVADQPGFQVSSLAMENMKYGFYGSRFSMGTPLIQSTKPIDPAKPNIRTLDPDFNNYTAEQVRQSSPVTRNEYQVDLDALAAFLKP